MTKARHDAIASMVAVLLCMVSVPAHAQDTTAKPIAGFPLSAWQLLTGSLHVEHDRQLDVPMATVDGLAGLDLVSSQRHTGDREVRTLVRLRQGRRGIRFALQLGMQEGDNTSGLLVVLTGWPNNDRVMCDVRYNNAPLHDLATLRTQGDYTLPRAHRFMYDLRAYPEAQPGWPVDFRVRIEHAMAQLPSREDKWIAVRVQVRDGRAAVYLDDRLVVMKEDPDLVFDGLTRMTASDGMQIAEFSAGPPVTTPGFTIVPLTGYANARYFQGGAMVEHASLPPAGRLVRVGGVPFVFAGANLEGNDHLDLGKSLYRQANSTGYIQTMNHRWSGAAERDPGRIQLRIPNDKFDSLYVIAAADGEIDSVPILTAMFYRPDAGFPAMFETRVPLATAEAADAVPLPVKLTTGQDVKLWRVRIPLDPGQLSAFDDMDIIEIELTKKVALFRSYPDPISYSYHQAGLPSSIHVYAVTLGLAPVSMTVAPDRFGHVWRSGESPTYLVKLANHTAKPQAAKVSLATKSYDGSETQELSQQVEVAPNASQQLAFAFAVKRFGYHDVVCTMTVGDQSWTETRSLAYLAPDERAERWTPGKGALFGYWSYHGGHHTPHRDHVLRLMTWAGGRTSLGSRFPDHPLTRKHWHRMQGGAYTIKPSGIFYDEAPDPEAVAKYKAEVIAAVEKERETSPEQHRSDHVSFWPEPHISRRLTAGNYPEYWNGEPYEYTQDETNRLRMFMGSAKAAAEAIREKWPELKILIPWGDPGFVIPMLRAGFPKELIDGSGIDIPGFERLPEQQLHQISIHRLYELRKEYEKFGLPNPVLKYVEGIFVPTEPGAVTWREQMDLYTRWQLISMAYGVMQYHSGWFAFDCGNYYGAEHYGGCGIQRRVPYADPKPAYAAYAAMTQMFDQANFDGWVKTGSLTNYLLRFKGPNGFVYAAWNIRGKRPVRLTFSEGAGVVVTDSMNNSTTHETRRNQVAIVTDPSVVYITGGEITAAQVGEPDNRDASLPDDAVQIADLGDGTWKYTARRDEILETNNFGIAHYLGKFAASVADDPAHGKVLESKLEKQDVERQLMPWYNTLTPAEPITLKGAPAKIGLWAKGASDWGRVIYILRDAGGERWTSIGTKDDYNCDDTHGWSKFNYDGWRYLSFELPGHTGYDNFRKFGTTWWGSNDTGQGADGIVDLPLALEEIIVEQRSHILYVNDVQPVASDTVHLGELYVEYASPEDMTDEAVRVSRLRMPLPTGVPDLPNPIARLKTEGVGDAPGPVTKLQAPEHYYDGTRMHVHFEPAAGAVTTYLWVGAYPDGRGAVNLTKHGVTNGQLVRGLRPGIPLYYWLTHVDEKKQTSKPSLVFKFTTIDEFKEK